ncbi:MAG: hypothetical protein HC777_00545 [Hyphomonadaceae bacterium]|nr:hypothetical protein [Hyphomonadaceae bacterium]
MATAQSYLAEGNYAWNAGIFFFKARALIDELTHHEPEMIEHVRAALQSGTTVDNVIGLDPHAFGQARSVSIDYALMEQTNKAAVVPVDMGLE